MSNESKTAVQFKTLYEQWEQYLKARYGQRDMYKLSQRFWHDEVSRCQKEEISENQLLGLVNIRNAHTHSSQLLEIKGYAVVLLRTLVNTFGRQARDVAVLGRKIHKVTPKTDVLKLVKKMKDELYTHVPVVEKTTFYGVFSENTLLKIVATGYWKPDLKIASIIKILRDRKGSDEYEFLPWDASFYDVHQLFQNYIDRSERLGVVFLTKNGKESGDIKGLITAWDLHKGLIPEQGRKTNRPARL